MPELPDVELYCAALRREIVGRPLQQVRIVSPFLVRSIAPPLADAEGRTVAGVFRVGKRIVWDLEDEWFFVFHLMVAGRFRWKPTGAALPGRISLAAFDFSTGTLVLTEAGSRKRASLHVVTGRGALASHDPGGLEPLEAPLEAFEGRLRLENHTLKRSLTDPHLFSGIGNAYSDEILHEARLSPVVLTSRLTEDEVARLYRATQRVLREWTRRLREEAGERFPEKVTAFREGMAVHGRFGQPCRACGTPVQRIAYAASECNYCPTCQTGGRLLADRGLSRLLGKDWPRTLEELERRRPHPR